MTLFLGWLLLGERIGLAQMAGMAMVIAGVALTARSAKR
ncbi:MAG: EamA family transporter [Azoarcus sp.]|nr:EamA family transporter [Azoarcus sp.]